MISLNHLGGGGSAWWIDGWPRRFINPIYIYARVPPLLDQMDRGVISFTNAHYVLRTMHVSRERIFLVYSPYVTLWPRKRERETDLNTLIPLISRVGSFKVSNGERFRLIKRRRLGSPDFAENLRRSCFPVIDYPLDIARYLQGIECLVIGFVLLLYIERWSNGVFAININ